jgi:outer membrane lipoprotein-sorting protein
MPKNDNHKHVVELYQNDDMEVLQEWVDAVLEEEPDEAQWQTARCNLAASLQTNTKENFIMRAIRNSIIGQYRWVTVSAFAVLIFAVVGGIGMWNPRPGLVFAEVLEQIRTVQTFHFTNIVEMENQTMELETDYMDPGKQRLVMPDGNIIIMDMVQGKTISLTPSAKMASVIDFSDEPNKQPQENLIETLRKLEDGAEELLGQKEMDGKLVYGFKVTMGGRDFVIWADLKTGLPVRVEMNSIMYGAMKIIMTDFEYNIDMDESLFSLEPPADYELITLDKPDMGAPTENDLIEMLQLVTNEEHKSFPKDLDIMTLSKQYGLSNPFQSAQPSNEDIKKFASNFAKLSRGSMFVQLNIENDWHYEPEGKNLGDAQPLYWWKPIDSETYRVIYCDLTAADVSPDEFIKE